MFGFVFIALRSYFSFFIELHRISFNTQICETIPFTRGNVVTSTSLTYIEIYKKKTNSAYFEISHFNFRIVVDIRNICYV